MSETVTNNSKRVKWEIEELSLLFDISNILDSSINLKDVLRPILKLLSKHVKIIGGLITKENIRLQRELENFIERAVLVSNDEVIHGHHLPPTLQTAKSSDTMPKGPLKAKLESIERELILDALKSNSGNMAKSANLLGITERQMGLRVRKYEIPSKRFHT